MKRQKYYNYIDEKLTTLSVRTERAGRLNLLSIHQHSENFYAAFFNLLFGFKLQNLNKIQHNVEAIDLIDDEKKIVIQVSATAKKSKVEASLAKEIMRKYSSYEFYFISIARDADSLRTKSYYNPFNVNFNPSQNIFDPTTILRKINSLENIDKLEEMYTFIKKELGSSETDIVRLDSNLSSIINILSKVQFKEVVEDIQINSFQIDEKIRFNQLESSRVTIEELCMYYRKVDEKYKEFDAMGMNKSMSVLRIISKLYQGKKELISNPDKIFSEVVKEIKEIIQESKNNPDIPVEELDLCVEILVVDAFTRCKIFDNPKDYNYVVTE